MKPTRFEIETTVKTLEIMLADTEENEPHAREDIRILNEAIDLMVGADASDD